MTFILLLLVVLTYAATMLQLLAGFSKAVHSDADDNAPETFFSIVVAFRNEVENLPALLESIRKMNYPKELFEVILIDDFSEDNSTRIVYDWRMNNGEFMVTMLDNINVTGSPKKDAISRAIPIVQREWIITTDADCLIPENWLRSFDAFIRKNQFEMIAAPVSLTEKRSFLRHFQQLDLAALQGATIGSFAMKIPFMCNGANFAYTKSVFWKVNGFHGNTASASGDDVFLLQKVAAQLPEKVGYLQSKDAIILTRPVEGWMELFSQKIRWASKTGSYQSIFGKDLALIVLAGNLAIIAAICWLVSGGCLHGERIAGAGILFSIKLACDGLLVFRANKFIEGRRPRLFILSSVIYPFFSVIVAVFSLVGSYSWKGRKYRR